MSAPKKPKFTTNHPQEFLKLKPWIEGVVLRYDPKTSQIQIFLRSGMSLDTAAQAAYISDSAVYEQLVTYKLNDGIFEPPAVNITKSADENGSEETQITIQANVLIGGNTITLAKFQAAGEFKKTIVANERGNDEVQVTRNLQQAFAAEWSAILSGAISQAAEYNEAEFYSALSSTGSAPVSVPAVAAHGHRQQLKSAMYSAARKQRKQATGFQSKPLYDSEKWPLWKIGASIAVFLVFILAGSYVFTKLVPSANKSSASASALQKGAISPDEIGKMVDQQKEAIANGGTDPYAGVDTGNVQIETLKRMGIDVGNTDLGCLASE